MSDEEADKWIAAAVKQQKRAEAAEVRVAELEKAAERMRERAAAIIRQHLDAYPTSPCSADMGRMERAIRALPLDEGE